MLESFGKLYTETGEVLAEGPCQVDLSRGSATLRPIVDMPLIARQKRQMHLELDDGTSLIIRASVIRFQVNAPGVPAGPAYRLFVAGTNGLDRFNQGMDGR